MPEFEIVATIHTSQTIEAETMEEAKMVAGLLDEWDFLHDWEEANVAKVEVFRLD